MLLERGAEPALQDEGGRTALHWAAVTQSTKCLQALCKAVSGHNNRKRIVLDLKDKESLAPLVSHHSLSHSFSPRARHH